MKTIMALGMVIRRSILQKKLAFELVI